MTRDPTRTGSETDLTIGNLARVGVIHSVDLDAGKAVVAFGDERTPPIDWLTSAGDTSIWLPPTVGEQVMVLAPEGDIEQALILGGLPSSLFAPLFKGARVAIRFKDGALLEYDPEGSALRFELPGSAVCTVPGGFRIEGDVEIQGRLHASGQIKSDDDVLADTISLKDHPHTKVQPGTGVSGPPQK